MLSVGSCCRRHATACSPAASCGSAGPAPTLACGALRARPGPSSYGCSEAAAADLRAGVFMGHRGGLVSQRPTTNGNVRCQSRKGLVLCHSVPCVGALATYELPVRAPHTVPDWLVACVGDAAKHLDQAPFLQLLVSARPTRLERHRVTHAVVQAPQLWRGIAEHLGKASPEALVLVHPISMGPESTSARAVQAARGGQQQSAADVLTGIAMGRRPDLNSDHHLRLAACARLLATSVARTEFAGRVGDCCDGDEQDRLSEAMHRVERDFQLSEQHGMGGQEVDYWGVVVQARARSEAEGCYVLKTVRSRAVASDCTCLHYSLIRVCKGEPLAAQLAASWLT